MNTQDWKTHIEQSIQKAIAGQSKLDSIVLGIGGFSTTTMRHLFNNLASKAEYYLEIGAYRGGTFCAAVYKNTDLSSHVFEDRSQLFGEEEVFEDLEKNIEKVKGHSGPLEIYWNDFFKNYQELSDQKFDMIFYDGEHSAENQRKAVFTCAEHASGVFLMIVDDFSWDTVGPPTHQAIKELESSGGFKCVEHWELYGKSRNDDPEWHNGLALFLMEKL